MTLASVAGGAAVSLDLVDLGIKRSWSLQVLQEYVASHFATDSSSPEKGRWNISTAEPAWSARLLCCWRGGPVISCDNTQFPHTDDAP